MTILFVYVFLGGAAYGAKLSLKLNGGGIYLNGGDYNKSMGGWRDYEHTVLGADETFVDNLKKLGLGFQFGGELMYELSPRLAAGIEVGYLSASVESSFSRTWHNYKWIASPTLSAIPMTLNIHYFMPFGSKLKLHLVAGAGALFSSLAYKYDILDKTWHLIGTWKPDTKTVFGAKAGVGLELGLTAKIALTFDILGRYAGTITSLTGDYTETLDTYPRSGNFKAWYYDYLGTHPMINLSLTPPVGDSFQNLREAEFNLSGVAALVGIRINL